MPCLVRIVLSVLSCVAGARRGFQSIACRGTQEPPHLPVFGHILRLQAQDIPQTTSWAQHVLCVAVSTDVEFDALEARREVDLSSPVVVAIVFSALS